MCTCVCLQAVLAGGKVYAVDRIDVTHTSEPPGVPVTLPSLMWSEITVQVRTVTDVMPLYWQQPGWWLPVRS
jgi:hypothetical protein